MPKNPVKYAVVSAFTDKPFMGNPAAVCLLEEQKTEDWLQRLAKEVNMPVTCYLTRIHSTDAPIPRFHLRFFNPAGDEVPLCGHGTMAAAQAVFTCLENDNVVEFSSLSGILTVKRIPDKKTPYVSSEFQNGEAKEDFFIEMDLPVVKVFDKDSIERSSISTILNGTKARDIRKIELDSVKDVINFKPQFDQLKEYPANGIIITGRCQDSNIDFCSRFFFPRWGVNEDIICGSAHCALADYWSRKLRKVDFVAHSAHPRGTTINFRLDQQRQRVIFRSKALKIIEGSVLV